MQPLAHEKAAAVDWENLLKKEVLLSSFPARLPISVANRLPKCSYRFLLGRTPSPSPGPKFLLRGERFAPTLQESGQPFFPQGGTWELAE